MEIETSRDGKQREQLRGLFAHVRDWVARKADDHFLEQRHRDSPKFIVHDVALRDETTARRIDRLPEAYLPMDKVLDQTAESLRFRVEHREPGPVPSREGSRRFIEVHLEHELKSQRDDAARVMARTSWFGRTFTDPISDHRDRIGELKKSLREIAAERDGTGRYVPAVNRMHDAAMADWEQARVQYRNQTAMLEKVEGVRELPLVERGKEAEKLVRSFDRVDMRREAGMMKEALHERPAFVSLPEPPERTRERSQGRTMERERGYDRSR